MNFLRHLAVKECGEQIGMTKNDPIIVATDLTIAYELHRERKKLVALQDISLAVDPGEFVVLVGPSGCGKTSFINAISGLVPKASGSVTVRGSEVTVSYTHLPLPTILLV